MDPLAALEKSTEAQNYMNQVQKPRIEALQTVADHYSSDPYSLSLKVRKRFREEKKVEKEKTAADNELKGRYGLPEELVLQRETTETAQQDREAWLKAKSEMQERESSKKRKLEMVGITPRQLPKYALLSSRTTPRASGSSSPADLLRARILANTARQKPPGSSSSLKR